MNSSTRSPCAASFITVRPPQTFRIGWFEHDYNALSDDQKKILTDACKIFILAGRSVHIVKGDSYNMKITTPFDLRLAEAIVAEELSND